MGKREYVVEDWNGGVVRWLMEYDRDGTVWTLDIHEAKLLMEKEAQLLLMTHCRNYPGAVMCKLSEVKKWKQ